MHAMRLDHQAPIEEAPLRPTDAPEPNPAPRQIRVRVHVCGICRTDLHVIEGDLALVRRPIIPGHQIVGVVDRVGPGCRRFKVGDRVGIAWLRETDGVCDFCRRGDENLCPASSYTGWHEDGGYAELALVREDFAYAIPDAFADDEAAPLLCAGIIGYRALLRSRVPDGGRLGIFGFGSSAHITMQIALARRCEVFVSTRGAEHRRLARELGASWVGEADALPPAPLDSAIVFAPAGEIVPRALASLRKGGTVSLAGIHMSPVPEMSYEPHLFHEKTLTSVEANTRRDGEELLRIAAEIPIRPRRRLFGLADANRALATLKHDGIDGTGVLVVRR